MGWGQNHLVPRMSVSIGFQCFIKKKKAEIGAHNFFKSLKHKKEDCVDAPYILGVLFRSLMLLQFQN